MLVLSRKQGQSIHLAEVNVAIEVISVKGSRVQLGIEAPPEITVTRPEKHGAETAGIDRKRREARTAEADRIGCELSRVETSLATLADLAESTDAPAAYRIAAESIERLESIRHSLRIAVNGDSTEEPRPIGDLLTVRTDVLEQLRQEARQPQPPHLDSPHHDSPPWPVADSDRPASVRQSSSVYGSGRSGQLAERQRRTSA